MTLLTAVFAAVISTALWYRAAPRDEMRIGTLCWLFWGASLMWLADAVFEYRELGAAYFAPAPADLLNDLFLGLSVVALGLVIWIVSLLIRDPKGAVRAALTGKSGGKGAEAGSFAPQK